jgi:hypothetical protein
MMVMEPIMMESTMLKPAVKTAARPTPYGDGAATARDSTTTSARLRIFFMTDPPSEDT